MSVEFETAYRLMLSELLPSLIHEFNNPLTAIGAVPGLLRSTKQDLESGDWELVESLQASVDSIHQLLGATRRILQADLTSNYAQIQPLLESLVFIMGPGFRRSRIAPEIRMEQPMPSANLASRYVAFLLFSALEVYQRLGRMADIKVYSPCELHILAESQAEKAGVKFQASRELSDGLPEAILQKLDGAPLVIDAELWQEQPIFARIMAMERELEARFGVRTEWRIHADGVWLLMQFP